MNYYPIIIALLGVGGLGISIWGWRVMQQSKVKQAWPTAKGKITKSEPTSEIDDLLPHIEFSYQVSGADYNELFRFPKDTNPMPEFAQSYVEKYPVGKEVDIFYNPEQPNDSTLEPATQGDWMIFALGGVMMFGAVCALLLA